ncbi:MAG: ATP-dependent Zn protease [Synechococcales bacterium]|nr:ATP-dependent Zn protease [Synechococcales bacterium]
MTLSVLLGPMLHIPAELPAIATLGVLTIATLDAFSWQSRGQTLFLDWVAGFSPQHRQRIVHHEAGHFLVAQQLGIPVTDYSLSAWEAFQKGFAGLGGVQFDTEELDRQLSQGQISGQWLDRFAIVWMAGIEAEQLVYGTAEGGADDREKLRLLLLSLKFSAPEIQQRERMAILRAKTFLQTNWTAYEALVSAMEQRATIADCQQILQATLATPVDSNPGK